MLVGLLCGVRQRLWKEEYSLQGVEETLDEAAVGRMITPPVVKKFHEEAASGVAEEIADELGSQIVAEHVVAVPVPQVLKEIIEVVRCVPRVVEQLVVSKSVSQTRCSKRLYGQIVDISLLHVIEWCVKVPRISIQNRVTRAEASDEAGEFAWSECEMASRRPPGAADKHWAQGVRLCGGTCRQSRRFWPRSGGR